MVWVLGGVPWLKMEMVYANFINPRPLATSTTSLQAELCVQGEVSSCVGMAC